MLPVAHSRVGLAAPRAMVPVVVAFLVCTTGFSGLHLKPAGRPEPAVHAVRASIARAHVHASLGRLVRQGIYAGFAIAGAAGGIGAVQELTAAVQSGAEASELLKSAAGLGVDVAVLAVVAFGYSIDQKAASGSDALPAQRAPQPQLPEALATIRELRLAINTPEAAADGQKVVLVERLLPVHVLQEQAKQTLVLAVGSPAAVQDMVLSAVVQARELTNLFATADVLLVPLVYESESGSIAEDDATAQAPKGFGKPRNRSASQTYIATPLPDERTLWSRAIDAEVAAARAQGARAKPPFDPLDKGLIFVLGSEQKVLQRRLGLPPWGTFLEEVRVGRDRERAQAGTGP